MTTAFREAFVIACLYQVVEGRISARDWFTIVNRERFEADMEKRQEHIDTQKKAIRKFIISGSGLWIWTRTSAR